MASSTGNIKQAYDVNGEKIYPKVILDAIEGEGGKTGMEIIKEAVGGIGMESLKGVSVEYDDIDGNHRLVFKSHYEESAGGYIKETIVGEGPLVIGNYSETNTYADDHIYVSKNLSILGDANTLEFAADANAVNRGDISGKIVHANNSIQIINNNSEGKLELFGGGEGATECVSISATSMNIPKDVSILNKLNVSGDTEVATTSGAKLSVGGDATFSNTITVNKKSRFKDDVSLEGQNASRGSSPKLSFTSYENKPNSTNRSTGYIVEHYGTSNNTSLEMYDGTENNAHLSLSGSDKTFTVKVNSNNALILDGSNKVAKIQPYSSDENSPSLVIDGSNKTTTLKSDNNTKLMLDASNAVLYGDSYRYMELNGSNGEINLNASADKKTYLKLDGTNKEINLNASADKKTYLKLDGTNGEIDLWADGNRFLSMPKNSKEVRLCSYGQGNVYTYLKLDGDVSSHPYTKLSALRDMRLGMNDVSGHLRLQAKGGTYLEFDVSGNNKSVGLCADASSYLQIDAISKNAKLQTDDNYYLQIDASKGEAKLYAGSVTGLHLNNAKEVHDVNLYADNSTYLKLLGGEGDQKVRLYANDKTFLSMNGYIENDLSSYTKLHADNETYIHANTHKEMDDEDNPYKVNEIYLTCRADSDSSLSASYIHIKDDTTLSQNAYIRLKSHNAKLFLDGASSEATLSTNSSDYIRIYGAITLHRSDDSILTVGDSVVSSTIPMTAKVNGVSGVYVGCPIGTIVMWAGLTSPDGWLICDGRGIALDSSYSEGVTVKSGFEDYQKLVNVIKNKYGGSIGSPSWVPNTGTIIGGVPYVSIPDLQQRFPLGAKTGTIKNGFNSSGRQINEDTSLGDTGGDSEVTLYAQTMPKHSHNVYSNVAKMKGGVSTEFNYIKTSDDLTSMTTTTSGDGNPHSNMPPYLAINFIIKYK